MSLALEIALFSLVLSVDSFSAATALGFRPFQRADAYRFAILSGGTEGIVTTVGFFCGRYILAWISEYDHWVAFALLLGVSLNMLWNALKKFGRGAQADEACEFHGSGKLLLVSLVTSFDALGVGLGLGVADKPVALYAPAIAVGAALATLAGLYLARRMSKVFGPRVELLGACVLLVLAFQMLKI